MWAFLHGPRSRGPWLAQIRLVSGIVRCHEHQRRGEGVEWRWKWNGSRDGCEAAGKVLTMSSGPVVPGTWVKNFTCRGLQEKQNPQRIQVRLRKGNGGKSFKDIKMRDTVYDKFIIFNLFKYCLVIIFSLHFAFSSVILSPPLPLYCSTWIFLEEEWGTFCYLVYPVSHLEPALVPTNNHLTILCHRLNMLQKSSPEVLGKIDTLNYWWAFHQVTLHWFMTPSYDVEGKVIVLEQKLVSFNSFRKTGSYPRK